MEEERRCAPISPHEARSRHAVRLTRSRGVGSGKESNPIPRYEKPRGRDSAHRQREGKRWTLPPPCKESAGGSSASRRRWCPKSGKVFSPATAGCGPGLSGLEPDVSRRASCSGEIRSDGGREGAPIGEEPAWVQGSLQHWWSSREGKASSPDAAGDNIESSGLKSGLPPPPAESNKRSVAPRTQ